MSKIDPNGSNKLSKWCLGGVSERSWELLGHPWGLKVGPRVDFDGFLEHFRLPFWMFSDQKSVFFRRYFLTSFYVGLGIIFGAFCAQFWMLFRWKQEPGTKKVILWKTLFSLSKSYVFKGPRHYFYRQNVWKKDLDSDMGLKSIFYRSWYHFGTTFGSTFDPKSI